MTHHEWASARNIQVVGAARPAEIDLGSDINAVAAIQLVHEPFGSLIIQGRPEDLVSLFRRALDEAESIVVTTMQDPNLRAMYGITS